MDIVWMLLVLMAFAVVGVPLAMATGLASFLFLVFDVNISITVIAQKVFSGLDSFPLMAIPFFVIAGALMNNGGLTTKLISFTNSLVGARKGALGQVTVISNVLFGAISGSAVAGASAFGSSLLPTMRKEGYPAPFSAALIAVSSMLSPIIPPSITLIMYGVVTGVPIGALFLGSIIPGILFSALMLWINHTKAQRSNLPSHKPLTSSEKWRALREVFWALLLPVIVFGGIFSGFFTVTEAAAVAAVYALLVGLFVYRSLGRVALGRSFKSSVVTVAVVMFLISSSKIYAYLVAIKGIPETLSAQVAAISSNPYIILFTINAVFLIVGMFLEPNAAIIVFVPIFFPLIQKLGIDPVHFGVLICFNLALGLITPPFGMCLSMTAKMADVKLKDAFQQAFPYLLAGLLVLVLMTLLPWITTFK